MRSLGRAHAESGAAFQLVGVAAKGTVIRPDDDFSGRPHAAELEPHHTHVVLVPGDSWGDESSWVSAVAAAIAGDAASVTLLMNGGAITLADADLSLAAGRPLVVLAGSGRAADDIAGGRALGGDRTARIADHRRTQIMPLSDGPGVVRALAALLNR